MLKTVPPAPRGHATAPSSVVHGRMGPRARPVVPFRPRYRSYGKNVARAAERCRDCPVGEGSSSGAWRPPLGEPPWDASFDSSKISRYAPSSAHLAVIPWRTLIGDPLTDRSHSTIREESPGLIVRVGDPATMPCVKRLSRFHVGRSSTRSRARPRVRALERKSPGWRRVPHPPPRPPRVPHRPSG